MLWGGWELDGLRGYGMGRGIGGGGGGGRRGKGEVSGRGWCGSSVRGREI